MTAVKAYSPSIKILSLILGFLVIFYLVPATVYADGLSTDFGDGAVSEAVENNSGDSEYSPSATHSAGIGGVGSINLATGKLTLTIPTLTTTDSLFAFTPTLVYNSSLAGKDVTSEHVDIPFATSYMPKGFKLNIQETIIEKEYCDENNVSHIYYTFYDADGTTHKFYADSEDNTKYYDDSGLRLTLSFSGGDINIENTSQTVRTYSAINDTAWHLTSITDKYGNQLIFEFNTSYQPTKVIVKPNGLSNIEMLRLLYENDKLIAVYNDSSKYSVIFSYSNNNLSHVFYCYGNANTTEQNVRNAYLNFNSAENVASYASATYTFNSNGYLTTVRDLEALRILRYVTTNGKVTKVSEYANNTLGQQVSYSYGECYTDVRYTGNDERLDTSDDIITRYVFDEHNRAVSVYSMPVDSNEIYGATGITYEDEGQNKNSVKETTVLYGFDPDNIIESTSNSGEYFATIQGGANTNASTGVYKQTVFLEENVAALTESNANMEYIISGFGYSNSVLQNETSDFSLGINVYYYQGEGVEDEVISYSFDFADIENKWQYVFGKFNCKLDSTETVNYDYVIKIEVVCSYYGHPDISGVSAYANFKDVALTPFNEDNGYNYSYDENGNLDTIENALYQETYVYNDNNQVTRITNSDGEIYEYEYTLEDGITTYSERYYKNNNLISSTAYVYNEFGLLTNLSYSGAVEDYFDEDAISCITSEYEYITEPGSKIFGALYTETDSLGNITRYDFDPNNGRLLQVINLSSNTGYKYNYYVDGSLCSVHPITLFGSTISEGDESVYYSYYANGELYYIMTESTKYNIRREYFGNVAEIEIGNRTLATYEYYSNNGKLKKINYGNGFSEEYVYNTLEMLSEVWYTYDDGSSLCAYKYEYTSYGQLSKIVDKLSGNTTVYRYDSNGRIISNGQYDSAEYELYSNEYVYDALSRISRVNTQIGYSVGNNQDYLSLIQEYGYSNNGLLGTFKTCGASIGYSYDSLNRYTNKTVSYADSGSTPTYTNEISYSYKPNSYFVNEYKNKVNGTTTSIFNYWYDSKGNITKITDKSGKEKRYFYDSTNKLSSVIDEIANKEYIYHYDNAGNVTSIITNTLPSGGGIGDDLIVRALNPTLPGTTTTTLSYTDSDWGDLLTSFNGHAITYDEIGNPLSYYNGSAYTFTWDGRRLASVEKGLVYATFTYNDEGLRLSKTIEGATTTYLYDGSALIAEYAPNYTCVYIYDESGAIIGAKYISTSAGSSWQTYFFEKNLQGDVIAVYSDTGTKLVSYRYDAWGNATTTYHNGGASTLAANNPIRYRSYYYDTTLQMYYLQSRYYDAKICRFINADSALYHSMLGYNMFTYCGNNPVNRFDYTGKYYEDLWNNYGDPLDDWFFDGAAGGGGSYYYGPGSAYYNYAVYSKRSISDANLIGYYSGGLSSGITNYGYYVVPGAIPVTDGMATNSLSGGACFVAGTLIKAAEGDVPIENIQVGDYVYAHNPETGETELKPVVQTFVNEATELVHVFTDGEEIICTNEHPFYSPVKGWIEACKLRAGDILVSLNGEYVIVEQVQHEILEAPIKVYNFEVEDFHTYFVGDADGVLVHNRCDTGSSPIYKTNSYSKGVAEELGYTKVNGQYSHGAPIYYNPNASRNMQYISIDKDSHNGGYWKAASSISGLFSKSTRTGTFTWDLKIRVGD